MQQNLCSLAKVGGLLKPKMEVKLGSTKVRITKMQIGFEDHYLLPNLHHRSCWQNHSKQQVEEHLGQVVAIQRFQSRLTETDLVSKLMQPMLHYFAMAVELGLDFKAITGQI